jgi:hypothetical protein
MMPRLTVSPTILRIAAAVALENKESMISPCLCIVLNTQPVLAIIGAMINASLTGSWPSSGLPVRILAKA